MCEISVEGESEYSVVLSKEGGEHMGFGSSSRLGVFAQNRIFVFCYKRN